MATVTSFEDLVAWQKARVLTREVYLVTRLPEFSRDFGLCSQMQRAAVSVMANIAEGFERRRRTEFHRFVEIAKGSCAELVSHLYVALDVGYLPKPEFARLTEMADEVQRILGGLKLSLSTSRASDLGPRNSP